MANTQELSNFLKADNVKDGDIITFVDPGAIIEKVFDGDNGKETKKILEILVTLNGVKKIYSPNNTTRKLLEQAWGFETDAWVGKKATISLFPAPNGKNMIVAKPVK